MSVRPLVIDGQLLQTTAWDRGMGHYCRSLLRAYGEAYSPEDVTIILNANLPLDTTRTKAIQSLLPRSKVVKLDLPTLTGDIGGGRERATRCLDVYLDNTFRGDPVDFLILQLFTFDYCAAFPTKAHKYVMIYDLIPLLHWQQFSRFFAAHMYFPHFRTILEADVVLVISEDAKRQTVESFALNPDSVINVRGAAIERQAASGMVGIDVKRPFLLMPTADFPHKNNLPAVQAFAEFNRELGNICQLVLTSNMSENTQDLLNCYSDDLVFVGNVSDADLAYLYKQSIGLLFISSIEGLGLPILEAVADGKPVVCSSISVFKEISNDAFYFCEPGTIDSITNALKDMASRLGWAEKLARYKTIRELYTWQNSAAILHQARIAAVEHPHRVSDSGPAIFLPNPAQWNTDLGGLAQSLAAGMVQASPIAVYVSSGNGLIEADRPVFLPWITSVSPVTRIANTQQQALYFIDDSDASAEVMRAAVLSPGICFCSTDSLALLIEGLEERGYLSAGFKQVSAPFVKDLSLRELLESQGNVVYTVRVTKQGYSLKQNEEKLSFSNKYELSQWLLRQGTQTT